MNMNVPELLKRIVRDVFRDGPESSGLKKPFFQAIAYRRSRQVDGLALFSETVDLKYGV
jgi:hypothetical protein